MSVVHLDIELCKGPRWKTVTKLDSRTHIKSSSFGRSAVTIEFSSEVGAQLEFIRIRDQFIEKLEKYNCDEIVINKQKS